MGREVLLLTDGDLPHSGRFVDCRMAARRGGKRGRKICESRRNRNPCPASRRFRERDGFSDEVQLERFGRRVRSELSVFPLVFDPTRPARPYRELAAATGGGLFRVPSAEALEAALPALLTRRVRGVHAENESTGDRTGDLLDPETGRFQGELSLAPGANDILLTVEGSHGPAGLYRFRIYSEPDHLRNVLVELRETNRQLAERTERSEEEVGRLNRRSLSRRLAVVPERAVPASPAKP
jgi:hypothetical protein